VASVADTDEWRTREFAATLEVVDADQDGRIVYGRAVPYGEITEVQEHGRRFQEEFCRGAFAKACQNPPDKVKFCFNHENTPIGVAQRLEERADGLYAELRMSKTSRGDDLIQLVRDGALNSLSVRFRGLQPRQITEHVAWREAMLREISLVPWGQYEGSWAAARSDEPVSLTPRLDAVRREVARFGITVP
jgi:HK97 family phage prohead protease